MGKGKLVAVISIIIVSFVSVSLIPVFAPSHPEYVGVDPPRKQIANGAAPHEVICSEGLELIFKATNGFPACVKPSAATKLVERGWGISFVVNLKATGAIVTGAHQVPNYDFVNTVINNPGEQEQPQAQCNPITIDFESDANGVPLSAGNIINNQWHTNDIHISASNDHGSHPNEAIIFNSNNPTGGDSDLGPPWSTGNVGTDTDLGNILIIAENSIDTDGDGLVDDPDDEAKGGVIYIDILNSNYQCSLGFDLIDIEQTEANSGYVLIIFEGGGSLKKHFNDFPGISYGDNSFNRFTLSAEQIGQTFNSVEIFLDGSGALDNISLG